MSESNPFRLFVSHAWVKDDDYNRFFEYLESTVNFFYRNVCDPDTSHEGESVADRRTKILAAMKEAEVFIVLATMKERYPDWIDFEVKAAKAHELPIIVIEPFGPQETDPGLKKDAAAVIGWNTRSMEDAIRMQARHDDSKRFDVIEFDM